MISQQIGTFEAKTHFSQIIEEVERGADYVITKWGRPIAKLIPFQKEPEMTRKEAFEKIKELRKNYKGEPGSFNIREAIEDGRK